MGVTLQFFIQRPVGTPHNCNTTTYASCSLTGYVGITYKEKLEWQLVHLSLYPLLLSCDAAISYSPHSVDYFPALGSNSSDINSTLTQLTIDNGDEVSSNDLYNIICINDAGRRGSCDLLRAVQSGLDIFEPTRSAEGCQGVYFLKDYSGSTCAVFKPSATQSSPHTSSPSASTQHFATRIGISQEALYIREYVAYLLDLDGFHGVPHTSIVSLAHPSLSARSSIGNNEPIGAHVDAFASSTVTTTPPPSPISRISLDSRPTMGCLQAFVPHQCSAEDVGPRFFSVHDVHKIGILDLRILNCDRHLGNMLVLENNGTNVSLAPIDHSLSLPPYTVLSGAWFEWLSFPQSKVPFDEESLLFIRNLDPVADVALLRSISSISSSAPSALDEASLHTLRICTMLLKSAAARGFTLFEIGCMMSRYTNIDQPCLLESVVDQALRKAGGAVTADFWIGLQDEFDTLGRPGLAA